jgi:hypothetical protein
VRGGDLFSEVQIALVRDLEDQSNNPLRRIAYLSSVITAIIYVLNVLMCFDHVNVAVRLGTASSHPSGKALFEDSQDVKDLIQ